MLKAVTTTAATSTTDTPMETLMRGPLSQFISVQPSLPTATDYSMAASLRKRVQFVDARVVSFITPGSSLSVEEKNELWYPTSDLNEFKTEARTLCRRLRGNSPPPQVDPSENYYNETPAMVSCSSASPEPSEESDMSEEEEEREQETRGLEHRVCLNRQRNKHLAIRCTLRAQRKSQCPYFIARISSRCTQWAKEVAIAEAKRDYCEAYGPNNLTMPSTSVELCSAPGKRGFETLHLNMGAPAEYTNERNVRRRTDETLI